MVPNLQRFKKVRFDDKLVVLYKPVYRTLFKLRNSQGFTIDKFGNYRSGNNAIIEGDMTLERDGDLLPFDYQATDIFPKEVRGF